VIDLAEASELFRNLATPSPDQEKLASLLRSFVETALFDDEAEFLIQPLSYDDVEKKEDSDLSNTEENTNDSAESNEGKPSGGSPEASGPAVVPDSGGSPGDQQSPEEGAG